MNDTPLFYELAETQHLDLEEMYEHLVKNVEYNWPVTDAIPEE